MSNEMNLVAAVRSGNLLKLREVLDQARPAGPEELASHLAFAMGMVCLYGTPDMMREMVARGGQVNVPDNNAANAPLTMAKRSGRPEVLLTLIELGVQIPEGFQCSLTEKEIRTAQAMGRLESAAISVDPEMAEWLSNFEEITIEGRLGVDTQVLESESLLAARRRDH